MLHGVKRRKQGATEEDEESAQQSEELLAVAPSINEVMKCMQTLKVYVFSRQCPSEEMMTCMINMSSVFSREIHDEKRMKQCNIYDYLTNKPVDA